jgi:phosphate transport system substrate-binding protein
MKIRLMSLMAAVSCFCSLSCSGRGTSLQGAGATFPAPLYKRWFLEYYKRHPGIRVNYQGIGSGAGIRQFTEGVVAFGASDSAMSKDEVKKFIQERGSDVQLLPMTAGSVVLCYNLPDGPEELRLSRKAYLGIFLGKITTWNDPIIAACNRGASLPSTDITVVRRAEGSGTTYALTNHLKWVSKDTRDKTISWKWESGASKEWPFKHMIGAKGNPGVAALIQQTPGAIGYLEYGYADLAKLPTAVLENHFGRYINIRKNPESGEAALKGVDLPKDYRIWVPDPVGKDAYPIVTYTWLLCYKDYSKYKRNPQLGGPLKEVIRFCLTEGQNFNKELGYIRLPPRIAEKVLKAVDNIKTVTKAER